MAYGISGSSPSLFAQQQRISGLPSDPQETLLAKYLIQLTQQNKVGTPEYFLAAGEFQNRQKMRQEQTAKQTQGPRVVENLTAQAVQKAAPAMAMVAPITGGVGSLDAGGMGRIESPTYRGAMGGIVAFEDGGEAKADITPEVEKLYTENLGRGSDVEGLRYWVDKFSKDNQLTADERIEFINAAAPEIKRRLDAGETTIPSYMQVNPEVRQALQSKDITTDEYKRLANYFGNQWIAGEAEDPASLTRRDYIERPRSGYDLATFLATRSPQHGAAADTQQRMADLLAPYTGNVGISTLESEGSGRHVVNPITGETEIAQPAGIDNLYRTYRAPHQGTIGDPEKGSRYAVGMDYDIDPKTGKARFVSPYTQYYKDFGHRDWQDPVKLAAMAASAYFFPGIVAGELSIPNIIASNAINAATKEVTKKAEGGEVKRYQNQGIVSSSPFGRDVRALGEAGLRFKQERTPGMIGAYNQPLISAEEDERMRLMQMLNQKYGGKGSLIQGYFTEQSPAEREQAKEIVSKLPTMSLAELRALAGTTPQTTAATTLYPDETTRGTAAYGKDSGIAAQLRDLQVANARREAESQTAAPVSSVAPVQIPALPPLDFQEIRNQAMANAQLISGERPEVPSRNEAVFETRETLKAAGYDFDLFKKQIDELNKQKDELKLDRKEAANLRILEAGLGILGGESPYAFVNIGKGASPALKGFAEDIKDLKKLERDRQKNIREIQVAQNQVAAGIGEKAENRLNKAQDRQDKYDSDLRGIQSNLTTSFAQLMSSRDVANLQAKVQFGVASLPGPQERLIRSLGSGDKALEKGARKYSELLGSGARGDTAARTAAFNTWSKSPRLQQEYPNFEDFFALRGTSGTGFTFLGKE